MGRKAFVVAFDRLRNGDGEVLSLPVVQGLPLVRGGREGEDFAVVRRRRQSLQIDRVTSAQGQTGSTTDSPAEKHSALVRVEPHGPCGWDVCVPRQRRPVDHDVRHSWKSDCSRQLRRPHRSQPAVPQLSSGATAAAPSRRAARERICLTCSQVNCGFISSRSAAIPVTCGAAMLVPGMSVYPGSKG